MLVNIHLYRSRSLELLPRARATPAQRCQTSCSSAHRRAVDAFARCAAISASGARIAPPRAMEGAPEPLVITPKEAIFDPASYGQALVTVEGTVVVLDRELGRIDISAGGAKLICRIDEMAAASDMLAEASVVRVTGRLRKQQRRTFLEAVDVYIVHPG